MRKQTPYACQGEREKVRDEGKQTGREETRGERKKGIDGWRQKETRDRDRQTDRQTDRQRTERGKEKERGEREREKRKGESWWETETVKDKRE